MFGFDFFPFYNDNDNYIFFVLFSNTKTFSTTVYTDVNNQYYIFSLSTFSLIPPLSTNHNNAQEEARQLIKNTLETMSFGRTEPIVRINPLNTPYGEQDLKVIILLLLLLLFCYLYDYLNFIIY